MTRAILPLILLHLALAAHGLHGQSDSPCNQGRSDPDPRDSNAICIPEMGRMVGPIEDCTIIYNSENFGEKMAGVGDVDHDGLADWVVSHTRCDTVIMLASGSKRYAKEVLLYHGVRGGLPPVQSGQRIGPTQIGSVTSLLASGDWDGDGNRDLAVRIELYNDTTNGGSGYSISHVVIFWGDLQRGYSLEDTTRLACDADRWLGVGGAAGGDLTGDGVDDLVINSSGHGFVRGVKVVRIPSVYLFVGHRGGRWGRQGLGWSTPWRWWGNIGNGASVSILDHDGDGALDAVVYDNVNSGIGALSVVYGRVGGGLPDTSQAERISFDGAGGLHGLLSDVSGDGIPELLMSCGLQYTIKVFIGLKHQRIIEQYGSGNEPAHPDSARWWGRPWAEVWQPRHINGHWFSGYPVVYDLGDGNGDGINDVWSMSWPYLLCYEGGTVLDSLADGLVDIRPGDVISEAAVLGEIDGSGEVTIGVGIKTGTSIHHSYAGGIIYLKGTRQLPGAGVRRRLPAGTDRPASGVEEVGGGSGGMRLSQRGELEPSR